MQGRLAVGLIILVALFCGLSYLGDSTNKQAVTSSEVRSVSRSAAPKVNTPLPVTVFFHCPECVEENIKINLFETSALDKVECNFPPTFSKAGTVIARSGNLVKVDFPNRCAGWISSRLLRGPGLPR